MTLGHVRLSILDLDARSNQPFVYNDSISIVFNGEVYNYKELAEQYLSDFTFRISNENLSCAKNYSKNTEKGVLANLMFLDWYKQIYHQLYPYEDFAVGIEQFHMPRLSFVKMIIYYYKFRKRGYMKRLRPNLTILKNWFKLRLK